MEKIALQAKLLLVNNNNKGLQLELFDLIRANLLKGDLIAVSKFYFFISKFSRLIYLHFRNISIHTLTNIDSKSGCKYNKKRES